MLHVFVENSSSLHVPHSETSSQNILMRDTDERWQKLLLIHSPLEDKELQSPIVPALGLDLLVGRARGH